MKPGQNNKPRLLALEVTRRCRFNCRHCRADADRTARADELSTEQWTRILDSVAAYEKCVIILTGGEPMERADIYDLIRHGRGLGLRMVMATCGYAIDDTSLARLREAGVMALSLSLDGATAETHDAFRRTPGAFDTVVRAAEAARRADMRFQVNTTITRGNLAEVPAIAELARRLGAYCWNPFILVPTGRGEEIADELLEPRQYAELLADLLTIRLELPIELRVTCGPQYARLFREAEVRRASCVARDVGSDNPHAMQPAGCMGGRGFGFISYRGDVQTCGFLDISAGNLVDSGYDFAKVWDGSKLLNEIRDLPSYKDNCGRCAYLKVCGGCRARAYAVTGDYLAGDPICWCEPRAAP
jgi:radical SAM protein with 4Fe4S-binding SPASM domain